MKNKKSMRLTTAVLAVFAALAANLGRGYDTVPESYSWRCGVRVVYEEFGVAPPKALSAHDILNSTLPSLAGSRPNELRIENGASTPAITELLSQLKDYEYLGVTEPSLDVRVVFVFTRGDDFSVLLAADKNGQFAWVNIKHTLPTLEQRKALWRTLPYEVVEQYPGPLKEPK